MSSSIVTPAPLATTKQVAAYLGVHPVSVARWASEGNGPPYRKVEGVRRYVWAEVIAWVESKKVTR